MTEARKNSKYTEDEVIRSLSKKHDIRINPNNMLVEILVGREAKCDLGNSSFGKIDYLTKHLKYSLIKVNTFNEKKKYHEN